MKVLMTTDTVGGVWTYALELARSQAEGGIEFVLATMGAALSESQRRQVESLDNVSVYKSVYKLEWMQQPWEDVRCSGHWLLDLANRIRPEVIHLNGYAHGSLPWPAPTLVVAHSCVLSWWEAVKHEPAPMEEWDRYRRSTADGLRAASEVVAPSQDMLDAVQRHYGPLQSGRVIYNGRDRCAFMGGAKQPFILTAGRLWDQAKNVAAVDQAAAQLEWPCYVAGECAGPDGAAAAMGSAIPLGAIGPSQMVDWLSRASIYALPARYEPFGLSILEAAMSGCALVLGDIPSLREIWAGAAVFVDPDDVQMLTASLRQLISDVDRRFELARRARLRALRYTADRMAAAYLSLYRSMCGQSLPKKTPQATAQGAPCAL